MHKIMQFSTLQEVSGDLSLTWMGSAAAAAAGVLTEKHLRSMEVDWRRDIIVNQLEITTSENKEDTLNL